MELGKNFTNNPQIMSQIYVSLFRPVHGYIELTGRADSIWAPMAQCRTSQ